MLGKWIGKQSERRRLCRHCFTFFRPERIGVVCRSERCREVQDHTGARSPRFLFADEWDLWQDGGDGPRLDLDQPCPYCERIGHLGSVCPHCRQPLGIEQGEDQVIAVIGASASGKSHFLATVLHQLVDRRVGGDEWHVALEPAALRPLRERFLDPLFRHRELLRSTADQVDAELALPLENRRDGRRVLLVFRDLGGELFSQPERLRQVGFLRYAQGVVLMVDPVPFAPALRSGPPRPGERQPDALEILEVYRRVLETQERDPDHRALPLLPRQKFLALAVTKADLVLPGDHSFWSDNGGAPYLERGYWRRQADDDSVRRWVTEHLSPRLAEEAASFAGACWFFVSSLGFDPQPGQVRLEREPDPRRVHEPIFALLDRLTADLAAPGPSAPRADAEPQPEAEAGAPAPGGRRPAAPGTDWDL
ncbi:MAG TPA: hypothetical protein VHQ65_15075 [Thermoanaerobaculia bacterium]|nr:hypothetical protein [Thermoanaerobaculia bacterium]